MSSDRYRVINGDALDAMRAMPHGSVDAVITDPPYASGAFTEAGKQQAKSQGVDDDYDTVRRLGWFAGDNMTTAGLVFLLRSVAFEAARVLVDGGSMLTFCDWRQTPNLGPALESAGLRWQQLIVWDKQSAGMGVGFRAQHEIVLLHVKGTGRFHDNSAGNVIRCGRVRAADRQHPTEKPLELLRRLVRTVAPPQGVVLDPFAGSGTTGAAALQEGRRFVGIEREPEYCALIDARLSGVEPERDGQLALAGEFVTEHQADAEAIAARILGEGETA